MEHINLHVSRKIGLDSILLWIRINCWVNNSGTRWYSKTLLSNHGCFIMFSWNNMEHLVIADRPEIVFCSDFSVTTCSMNNFPSKPRCTKNSSQKNACFWNIFKMITTPAPNSKSFAPTYFFAPMALRMHKVPSYQSTLKVKSRLRHFLSHPGRLNIEPENDGLENDVLLPGVYSQVPC